MKTISLDASTTCIGWSIWDEDNLVSYGKIKPTIDKLEWRDRIQNLIPQLNEIIKEYKPSNCITEDVPLFGKGNKTLVQLGSVQGMILGVCYSNNIEVNFITVSKWRSDIGLFTGNTEDKKRENLKPNSIKKANELFGLNLNCIYSKNGVYQENKSDDDISDSILLYASTCDKYKVKPKLFGKERC